VLTPKGIYDFLLGIAIDYGFGPANTLAAIRQIIRRAMTKRSGKRDLKSADMFEGPGDNTDQAAMEKFCRTVKTLVADGGPTEQRALTDATPLGGAASPDFPRAEFVSRDAPHKHRSIQKAVWLGHAILTDWGKELDHFSNFQDEG
jgi:hypothetical protein